MRNHLQNTILLSTFDLQAATFDLRLMTKPSGYQLLVYIAYGFYILLGLSWLGAGLLAKPSHINPFAILIMLVFGLQAYYRHVLTNLILGVLCLFFSIFMMLLPSLNVALQPSAKGSMPYAIPLVFVSLSSVILAGILIFSYMKLNFKD
jgi:hypothetical protein